MSENYLNATFLHPLKKIGIDPSFFMGKVTEFQKYEIVVNYENILKIHKINPYDITLKKLIVEDVTRRLYGISQAVK